MGRLLLGLAGWKGRLVCSRHVPAGPISLGLAGCKPVLHGVSSGPCESFPPQAVFPRADGPSGAYLGIHWSACQRLSVAQLAKPTEG